VFNVGTPGHLKGEVMKGIFKRLSFLFSDEFAVITKREWDSYRQLQLQIGVSLTRTNDIAEKAYAISEGFIPDSGISATSFDGAPIINGIPVRG